MSRSTDSSFGTYRQSQVLFLPAARPGLASRILGTLFSLGLLALALTFSLAAFVVLAIAGLGFGGWLWWKTRAMRKILRSAAEQARQTAGRQEAPTAEARRNNPEHIIEGEVLYRETGRNEPQ